MKIGITADCSSDLEYAPFEHNIKITRTTIHFGEENLVDGIDIKADAFYDRLRNTDIIPSTSAPTPEQLISRAEEWKAAGCTDVIHFPISFGLSAYGENLLAVKDDYIDGINYHVFNCKTASMMEGYTAHYAEILASKGYSVEEIFAECNNLIANAETFFLVDDLKYLVKNGRLNAASGTIGSLLRIKPILVLGSTGTIDPLEKVRTHSKALDRMIEIVNEKCKDAKRVLYIVQHTAADDQAEELLNRIKNTYTNGAAFVKTVVTPTIGAHIGCGVLSVGYLILDNLKEEIL